MAVAMIDAVTVSSKINDNDNDDDAKDDANSGRWRQSLPAAILAVVVSALSNRNNNAQVRIVTAADYVVVALANVTAPTAITPTCCCSTIRQTIAFIDEQPPSTSASCESGHCGEEKPPGL
jgi:hypothetical protein